MGILAGLEPKVFFDRFEEISAIPRGSYHEEAISNHLKKFAEERGCTVFQDEYFNLLIKVPASKLKAYKTLLVKKGVPKTAKIKK